MIQDENNLLAITVFTDPLCCWSWAFEPQLRQLKSILAGKVSWHYRMGGLIPSWNNFHDHVNAVSRPVQMGPVWMHAGQIANQPIQHQIWMNDPPASSYPACIAVKCAQLQSSEAGESMLNIIRSACMTKGKNIAKQDVLFEAAATLSETDPDFDLIRFKTDFFSDKGLEAFRSDLELIAYYRINRFPALVVQPANSKAFVISGYRQYEEVLSTMQSLCN